MTILERTEQIFLKGRVQPVNQHKYDEAFAQAVEERFQAEREETRELIAALQAENVRLTTALEWYADKDNYWARLEKAALVLVDHGKRATKALKP